MINRWCIQVKTYFGSNGLLKPKSVFCYRLIILNFLCVYLLLVFIISLFIPIQAIIFTRTKFTQIFLYITLLEKSIKQHNSSSVVTNETFFRSRLVLQLNSETDDQSFSKTLMSKNYPHLWVLPVLCHVSFQLEILCHLGQPSCFYFVQDYDSESFQKL